MALDGSALDWRKDTPTIDDWQQAIYERIAELSNDVRCDETLDEWPVDRILRHADALVAARIQSLNAGLR